MGRQGLAGVHVTSAADAVHHLADMAPAAVVVDLLFSDMDPRQLVRRALVCRETHGSPVLLLAASESDDRDVWIEEGCAAVLPRVTTPAEVAQAVQQAMRRR
jgi:CheY-like chemotaxis protein